MKNIKFKQGQIWKYSGNDTDYIIGEIIAADHNTVTFSDKLLVAGNSTLLDSWELPPSGIPDTKFELLGTKSDFPELYL